MCFCIYLFNHLFIYSLPAVFKITRCVIMGYYGSIVTYNAWVMCFLVLAVSGSVRIGAKVLSFEWQES